MRTYLPSSENIYRHLDWTLIICYLVLVIFGWMNVLASCNTDDGINILDFSQKYSRQLIWILSAFLIALFIIFGLDPKFYRFISVIFYIIVIGLLAATIFIGNEVNGSKSWLTFGPFSFQPAEISKIATSMLLATFMSSQYFDSSHPKFKDILAVALIMLIPMVLILAERETGSVLVYCGFFLMFYREGMPGWVLIAAFTAIALFILTLVTSSSVMAMAYSAVILVVFTIRFVKQKYDRRIPPRKRLVSIYLLSLLAGLALIFGTKYIFNDVLQEHQKARIEQLLGMKKDIMGVGYNVHQSEIAIGSGGLTGKGFLHGTQTKYNFVPEQSTDFIFCTVGEEWGFLGSMFVLILYATIIIRIFNRAERNTDPFTRIYGYCVASLITMHVIINIGMTIGLVPVIGIPLPFISYGGSSLWSFTILLFVFIRQDLDSWKTYKKTSYV
ncbi:MAG: rod shape-determining protein RodA [Bacteroidales bacterium]|jgi:rod shape determining protein RodA|nr:rod shape-determining protein RodA [Bacteroidales bacterium]MCI2121088.1 rod shape-determining protein RodA [Bacteroidales bacterium]MCI2144903.1 rod shape-determining protein RodA [Bacteroidales bacterium]